MVRRTLVRRSATLASAALVLMVGIHVPQARATEPVIVPGRQSPPRHGSTTTGAGINHSNTNAQLIERIPSKIAFAWRQQPPLQPFAGNDSLSETVTSGSLTIALDEQYQYSAVSAYRTRTGVLVWRRAYHFATAMVSDGHSVYVLHDDYKNGTGIDAIDIPSGRRRWEVAGSEGGQQPNLAVGSGLLINNRRGIDTRTGRQRFFLSCPAVDDFGQGLIARGRLWFNNDDSVMSFDLRGHLLWSYAKQGGTSAPGWGEALPQLAGGRLYLVTTHTGGYEGSLVLDARTGRKVRVLRHSDQALALDGRVGLFTANGFYSPSSLSAVDLSSGHTFWTFTTAVDPFDGIAPSLVSPPVIENGLVWLLVARTTDRPGVLLALDERTGTVRSTTVEPCNFAGVRQGEPQSLEVAQGELLVPSGCGLIVYRGVSAH